MKSHALGDLFNHHSIQVLVSLLILSSLLLSCNQPQAVQSPESNGPALKAETKVALPDLPVNFPHIERRPEPVSWGREAMTVVPTYDPNSSEMWQMDLRSYDLSGLDLRNSLDDLMFADFDSRTKWPADEKMPASFDRQRIMDIGKNPGLGLRALHDKGITGRGVGIAIIDQPLLVDHQEYKDQLRWYEEADGAIGMEPAMHGAAVASIAVGKTVGVAPDADLYFFATYFCNTTGGYADNDFACLAKSVDRVLAVNAQLPTGRKIRVISISVGWDSTSKGYKEITDAVNAAKAAGMLVICSSVEDIHGFKFNALGREPLSDPDQFTSYEPGIFWANTFYDPTGKTADFFANRLMVPMDSRTTASPTGVDEYVFYREGGWSWSIPYIAGMFALAVQVKPAITPDEFWNLGLQSGQTIQLSHAGKAIPFGPILDPAKLIEKLQG